MLSTILSSNTVDKLCAVHRTLVCYRRSTLLNSGDGAPGSQGLATEEDCWTLSGIAMPRREWIGARMVRYFCDSTLGQPRALFPQTQPDFDAAPSGGAYLNRRGIHFRRTPVRGQVDEQMATWRQDWSN